MKRDRLNEIKKWKDDIDLIGCEVSEHNFYTIHIEWLIKQAERVEELEQQNKYFRKIIRDAIDEISFFETRLEEEVNESLRILEKELEESE